jgi:putative ABC transport system permease protein
VGVGDEPSGFSSAAAVEDEVSLTFKPARVDTSYIEALGLEVVAGRGFTAEDAARAGTPVYVLNETAVQALGWAPDEAIGKPFNLREEAEGTVIGVVQDFHVGALREAIPPVSLQLHEPEAWSSGDDLAVRFAPDAIRAGLAHVEARVADLAPDAAFDYRFLDDTFDAMYRAEERLGHVFLLFAGLAVVIACLGLFGLATHAAEQRTKEIGIRKTLGATAGQIVRLLTQEFAVLVAVAFVIAAPAAYWGMSQWLADFAYRLTLGPGVFAAAGAVALALALATVGTQALRAARTDPAEALRAE